MVTVVVLGIPTVTGRSDALVPMILISNCSLPSKTLSSAVIKVKHSVGESVMFPGENVTNGPSSVTSPVSVREIIYAAWVVCNNLQN